MSSIRVVGLVGAGRADGNTVRLVREGLAGAREGGASETTLIHLGSKRIIPCRGYACDHCRKHDGTCVFSQKDDFESVFSEMRAAHGIVIGTPVHLGGVSSNLWQFLERIRSYNMRCSLFGEPQVLRNKVGGALAVGIHHYGGQEFAVQTLINFFIIHGMVVVSRIPPYAYVGGCAESGVKMQDGRIACPPDGVERDLFGLASARAVGYRVAEVATLLERGTRGT